MSLLGSCTHTHTLLHCAKERVHKQKVLAAFVLLVIWTGDTVRTWRLVSVCGHVHLRLHL